MKKLLKNLLSKKSHVRDESVSEVSKLLKRVNRGEKDKHYKLDIKITYKDLEIDISDSEIEEIAKISNEQNLSFEQFIEQCVQFHKKKINSKRAT